MNKNTRMWIGFLLIFLFGAAVGISGTTYFVRNHIKGFIEGGPPAVNQRIIFRILHDIDLTESQREKIDEIMLEYRPEVIETSREFGISMREITSRQIESIKEVLTPEQREIMEEKVAEFEQHFKNRLRGMEKGECGGPGRIKGRRPPPHFGD